jgi:hypothetical protein
MLYQKDPKYAHLPHSEWLKTPDGERWRQASQKWSQEFSAPAAGPVRGGSREDRIRDLMGRRPVSERGPVTSGPGRPSNQPEQKCYPGCRPDGTPTNDEMCRGKPDPNCPPGGPRPPAPYRPCGSNRGDELCNALGGKWPGAPWVAALQPSRDPGMDKTKPGWSAGMTQYQR